MSDNCRHFRIVGALGITNDHVYAETPDGLIERLRRVPIEPALFTVAQASAPTDRVSGRPPDDRCDGEPVAIE